LCRLQRAAGVETPFLVPLFPHIERPESRCRIYQSQSQASVQKRHALIAYLKSIAVSVMHALHLRVALARWLTGGNAGRPA
jgi:hypothetical protein